MFKMIDRQPNGLGSALMVVLLLFMIIKEGGTEPAMFRFSIQPPPGINCNPINKSILLVCGVTRITGADSFQIQWIYESTSENEDTTNHTDTQVYHNSSTDYLKIVEYNGLDMVDNVTEIAGRYWCDVRSNGSTRMVSNVLVIDENIDYSQYDDCKDIIIEEVEVRELHRDCSVYVGAFTPILILETIGIIGLVVSNVVFIVLWYRRFKTDTNANNYPVPKRPSLTNKKSNTTIPEIEYDSMFMSLTDIRNSKKIDKSQDKSHDKSHDPDYVLPNTFFDTKFRTKSTPNLSTDQESEKTPKLAPFTKEVEGRLYAIANPNTRDAEKCYQGYSLKRQL